MGDEELTAATSDRGVATVVLNRPRALNALSFRMIARMCELLEELPAQGVRCIIVKGAGGKAFCAGGDVKAIVEACKQGNMSLGDNTFSREYEMDLLISRLRIPYVSLIDGIVMGGGAGVSMHGQFRVATERTVFAMPECAIGLFPDVGANFFLNQLAGALGMYLGLTGARLTGVTVREAGLATHYLPSHAVPELERRLHALAPHALGMDSVARLLDGMEAEHGPMPAGSLPQLLPLVNRHFSQPSVSHILQSLSKAATQLSSAQTQLTGGASSSSEVQPAELQFVRDTLQMLNRGSPLSMLVTHALLQRSAHASLATCLESDTAMINPFTRGQGDFWEGVSAMLIEKRAPVWKYRTVDEVPEEAVEAFFEGGPFARTGLDSSLRLTRSGGSKL